MDWDQAEMEWIGAVVLVGMTYVSPDGTELRQEQFYGQITVVDRTRGIALDLSGRKAGEIYWLPPDLRAFEYAPRGDYALRSTNEVVRDPDFISQWTIEPPRES